MFSDYGHNWSGRLFKRAGGERIIEIGRLTMNLNEA
jgi:hypothetical protein